MQCGCGGKRGEERGPARSPCPVLAVESLRLYRLSVPLSKGTSVSGLCSAWGKS